MNKLLRKYQKWILVIGGSLLMVAFLIQGAANKIFQTDPAKVTVARLGDRKITRGDLAQAEREYRAADAIARLSLRLSAGIENSTHWFLLGQEADAAGLIGDAGDGEGWLPELAETETILQYQVQFRNNPEIMRMIMQNRNLIESGIEESRKRIEAGRISTREMTPEDVDRVLARLRGILRLVSSDQHAQRLSDRMATIKVKRLLDAVATDVVVVDARKLAALSPAPTAAEMQAHFDKYKAQEPEKSPNGIGYFQPPRVKLEWIKLDWNLIKGAITPDPVQVNKVYQQDQAEPDKAKRKYPGEFATEKANIEKAIVDDLVTSIMDESEKVVKATMSAALRNTKPKIEDDGLFKKLPPDWETQPPKLQDIAAKIVDQIAQTFKITIPPPPVEVRAATWMTQDDVKKLDGIGSAQVRLGSANAPVSAAAFQVREFKPEREQPLQVGLTYTAQPATDDAKNRYYFTVLSVREKGPAETLAEVADKVEKDVRSIHAFEKIKSEAGTYVALAISDGLEAVGKQVPEGVEAFKLTPRIMIRRDAAGTMEPALNDKEFIAAVIKAAGTLDPLAPASQDNLLVRTLAVPVEKELSVVVAQIVGQQPMTIEQMRRLRDSDLFKLKSDERQEAAPDAEHPFALKTLKARLNYRPEKGEDEDAKKTAEKAGS